EHRLRVGARSPIVGQRLDQLDLRSSAGINIIAIERRRAFTSDLIRPTAQTEIAAGDVLFLDVRKDGVARIEALKHELGLDALPLSGRYFNDRSQEIGMAELMVPADSRLIGRTVVELGFRSQFDLNVIGMKRGTEPVTGSLLDEKLALGDTLLVVGPW